MGSNQPSSFQLQFDPKETEKIIRLTVKSDKLEEANEDITIMLSGH